MTENKFNLFLELTLLFVIVLLGFFVNESFNYIPLGTDLQNHIGSVNNIIAGFKNDIGPFPYPMALNDTVAITSLITKLDIPLLFHVLHFLVILLIVLSFYRLGKVFSQSLSLILPLLIVLFYSLQDWLGLAYIYPSTLVLFLIPFFIRSLILAELKDTLIWLLLSFLLYWPLVPLLLLIFGGYFLLKNKKYISLILIFFGLIFSLLLLKHTVFYSLVIHEMGIPLLDTGYLTDVYIKNIITFSSVFFLGFLGLFTHERNSSLKSISLSMLMAFIIILTIWDVFTIRSTFIFITSWVILSGIYLHMMIVSSYKKYVKLTILSIFLVFLIITIVNNNKLFNFSSQAISENELQAFYWLKGNQSQANVLSDYSTVGLVYSWSLTNTSQKNVWFDYNEREKVYQVLEEPYLTENSEKYLKNQDIQYVIISYRTSRAIYEHEVNKRMWQPSSPDERFIRFGGYNKFLDSPCFRKDFDNTEVQIFRIVC